MATIQFILSDDEKFVTVQRGIYKRSVSSLAGLMSELAGYILEGDTIELILEDDKGVDRTLTVTS